MLQLAGLDECVGGLLFGFQRVGVRLGDVGVALGDDVKGVELVPAGDVLFIPGYRAKRRQLARLGDGSALDVDVPVRRRGRRCACAACGY